MIFILASVTSVTVWYINSRHVCVGKLCISARVAYNVALWYVHVGARYICDGVGAVAVRILARVTSVTAW